MSSFYEIQLAQARTNPYRTPQDDLKLWKQQQPKKYEEALGLVQVNDGLGFNVPDNPKNMVDPNTLTKDLNTERKKGPRPQRPTDFDHLFNMIKRSDGKFDYAQAGPIHRSIRPDGSSNTWEGWHRVVWAALANLKFIEQTIKKHSEEATLEECRIQECRDFNLKNGYSKYAGQDETFEKEVVELKSKETSKKNSTLAIAKLLDDCKICPTGSRIYDGYTKLKGIVQTKKIRKELHLIYQDEDSTRVDELMKKVFLLQKRIFPNEALSSYLHEAICWVRPQFQDISAFDLKSLEEYLMAQKQAGITKQTDYISGSKSDGNIKGKSKESIAMRIVSGWNDWMKDTGQKDRKPISTKKAVDVFSRALPKPYVESSFVTKYDKVRAQCPSCDEVFVTVGI